MRPIHLFGSLGALLYLAGVVLGIYLVIIRFFYHITLTNKTTPILAVFLIILGVQFVISGILADILAKIYFGGRENNYVKRIIRKG